MPTSIKNLIRDHLSRTRETQSEFARRTGISAALVSKLTSGSRTTVGRSTIPKLAAGLGIPDERIIATVRHHRPTRHDSGTNDPDEHLHIPTWRSRLASKPVALVGREPDRRRLSKWMGEVGVPCMVLTAEPGAGKTTIANAWLEEDVLQRPMVSTGDAPPLGFPVDADLRPHRIFHWSYTSDPEDFEASIRTAVDFLDPTATASTPNLSHCSDSLVRRLNTEQFLLILDGVDLLNPIFNESIHRFFSQLPALSSGTKILLIARCIPRCMSHTTGKLVSGCRHATLSELGDEDALSMLHQMGIEDQPSQLMVLAEHAGRNPQLLMELAGQCKFGPIPMSVPDDLHDAHRHLHAILSELFEEDDCALDDNAIALARHLATTPIRTDDTTMEALQRNEALLMLMALDADRPRQVMVAANRLATAGMASYDPLRRTIELKPVFRRWVQYEYTATTDGGTAR